MQFWKQSLLSVTAASIAAVPSLAKAQVSEGNAEANSDPVDASGGPKNRDRSTSAAPGAKGFSAEIGIEARYDSNVVIDDIDLNIGLGDEAFVFTARGDYEGVLAKDTTFSAGYRFSDLDYNEFSNLDLQTHSLSAGVEHDFGPVDASLDYRFTHARLGGDGFVDIQRISPSVSGYASRKVLLRGAYIYTDKNFLGRDDRDAEVHGIDAQSYILLDGAKTYVVLGVRFKEEDARDDQFSFDSVELRARFVQRFNVGKDRAYLRLGARYESRDFKAETPSIGEVRDEDRLRLSAEIEWRPTKRLELAAAYEYSDFNSNLATVNYTQSLFSVSARVKF